MPLHAVLVSAVGCHGPHEQHRGPCEPRLHTGCTCLEDMSRFSQYTHASPPQHAVVCDASGRGQEIESSDCPATGCVSGPRPPAYPNIAGPFLAVALVQPVPHSMKSLIGLVWKGALLVDLTSGYVISTSDWRECDSRAGVGIRNNATAIQLGLQLRVCAQAPRWHVLLRPI